MLSPAFLRRYNRSVTRVIGTNYASIGVLRYMTMFSDTTIVRNKEEARVVMTQLMDLHNKERKEDGYIHAADTEVADIDMDKSPVGGNGRVICASIYTLPSINYGAGRRIFIDNCDECEGTLDVFKPFFESNDHIKVWHNYSFDRHVLYNHGINAQGFGGDTMHMARLWDSSRTMKGGYSLEQLSIDLNVGKSKMSMKERFGKLKVLKNGSEGKLMVVPDVLTLHRTPEYRSEWIDYSATDAESTLLLYMSLREKLKQMKWSDDTTMMDFYNKYLVPFGECLTDMERNGIKVDVKGHLPAIQIQAENDRVKYIDHFISWARTYCDDAKYMNINSDTQKQQFLFAPCDNMADIRLYRRKMIQKADIRKLPLKKEFQRENVEGVILEGKKKALKHTTFTLEGLGLDPVKYTANGWPAVSAEVLKTLAGNPSGKYPSWGSMLKSKQFKKKEEEAKTACRALDALNQANAVDTMLNTFIVPLQTMADSQGRVHCSLNLNTETGRLSARRPNLQNQPALEKDIYKIRSAFTCEEGNMLLVADYGQLELRVLAHMTKCESMINAFRLGGDFHSRTALGMYPYIQEALDKKECYLEWDYANGEPDKPLLKDMFASERRKAKILNFSIAYGKTAQGLAKDFGVSVEEAKATVELWYADRKEVRDWQARVIKLAFETQYTRTLMGRYRKLDIYEGMSDKAMEGHGCRAAINTPIQGGAADIVMMAMIKIHRNPKLKELGWKMLLQIHDEVILEGPKESGKEAMELLIHDMEFPMEKSLLVDLKVDAKLATNWYEGK